MPPRYTAFCHDLRDIFMYSKKIYTSFRNSKPTSWSEAEHTGEAGCPAQSGLHSAVWCQGTAALEGCRGLGKAEPSSQRPGESAFKG